MISFIEIGFCKVLKMENPILPRPIHKNHGKPVAYGRGLSSTSRQKIQSVSARAGLLILMTTFWETKGRRQNYQIAQGRIEMGISSMTCWADLRQKRLEYQITIGRTIRSALQWYFLDIYYAYAS